MALAGGAIFALGIFLFVWSLGRRAEARAGDSLSARLKIYEAGAVLTERDLELQTSFIDRVIRPNLDQAGTWLISRTPEKERQSLTYKLAMAGRSDLSPEIFLALRIGLALVAFLGGLTLGFLLGNPLIEAVGAAVGAGLGYYLPTMWINQKVSARQKAMLLSLPDVLDLLTISVEAGLSFDLAVQRVVQKFKNPLADELHQVQTEVQLGRPRLEALDAMGRRSGVDEVHNFVQAIVQSEQMGVGISRILRLQADEVRRKRRQRAQEKAAQATLKMMLPMVGCIFPTLWIVLLGPAILIIMKTRG